MKTIRNLAIGFSFLFVFLFFACGGDKSDNIYEYPLLSQECPNKYVFLIGLDGWGGYSFKNQNMFDMPTVQELANSGSYTLKALSVMPSITIPNWASMFMGALPSVHGYKTNPPTNNDAPYAESTYKDKYGLFPSIFVLLKKQRPQCKAAYFFEKPKIGYLTPDNVLDKKQNIINLSSDSSKITNITSYIEAEKPNFTAVVFLEPDGAGHNVGHNTTEYYNELKKLDAYIAQIVTAIKNAGIWNDSIIILSSDHGGIGKGHGQDTSLEREIPLIAAGKNIRNGYEITEPTAIYDIAVTIAHIFELEIPPFWQGKKIDIFTE